MIKVTNKIVIEIESTQDEAKSLLTDLELLSECTDFTSDFISVLRANLHGRFTRS